MPSRPCKHPTCTEYVTRGAHFCAAHLGDAPAERRESDRRYDQGRRDREAKSFYNSSAWKLVRDAVIAAHPLCQICNRRWGRHVHHRIPLAECTPEQRLDPENLQVVCIPCHNVADKTRGMN